MMNEPGTAQSSAAETRLEQMVLELRRERDELRVRAHLLGAELREEWQRVEHRWAQIEPKLSRLQVGTRESAHEVGAAVAKLAEEIAAAYRRMRDALR